MSVAGKIREVIREKGLTQTWVVNQMNLIDPQICMNRVKFSAIVCEVRKMSSEELIAFCKAIETSPDIFLEETSETVNKTKAG